MLTVTDEELRVRVAELNLRISMYEVALAYARKEREKVETALEVVAGFHDRPTFPEPILPPAGADDTTARPADVPTIPLMIQEVLGDAAGAAGLEPKEIVGRIRERFWGDVPSNSIRSTLWRLLQEGRVLKNGRLYALNHSDDAPITAEGPASSAVTAADGGGREA